MRFFNFPAFITPLMQGVTVTQEASIEIESFCLHDEIERALPRKRFENERIFAVTYKLPELQQLSNALEKYEYVTSLENFAKVSGAQCDCERLRNMENRIKYVDAGDRFSETKCESIARFTFKRSKRMHEEFSGKPWSAQLDMFTYQTGFSLRGECFSKDL